MENKKTFSHHGNRWHILQALFFNFTKILDTIRWRHLKENRKDFVHLSMEFFQTFLNIFFFAWTYRSKLKFTLNIHHGLESRVELYDFIIRISLPQYVVFVNNTDPLYTEDVEVDTFYCNEVGILNKTVTLDYQVKNCFRWILTENILSFESYRRHILITTIFCSYKLIFSLANNDLYCS